MIGGTLSEIFELSKTYVSNGFFGGYLEHKTLNMYGLCKGYRCYSHRSTIVMVVLVVVALVVVMILAFAMVVVVMVMVMVMAVAVTIFVIVAVVGALLWWW